MIINRSQGLFRKSFHFLKKSINNVVKYQLCNSYNYTLENRFPDNTIIVENVYLQLIRKHSLAHILFSKSRFDFRLSKNQIGVLNTTQRKYVSTSDCYFVDLAGSEKGSAVGSDNIAVIFKFRLHSLGGLCSFTRNGSNKLFVVGSSEDH